MFFSIYKLTPSASNIVYLSIVAIVGSTPRKEKKKSSALMMQHTRASQSKYDIYISYIYVKRKLAQARIYSFIHFSTLAPSLHSLIAAN